MENGSHGAENHGTAEKTVPAAIEGAPGSDDCNLRVSVPEAQLLARRFVIGFEKAPAPLAVVDKEEISARWPHDASLMGVAITQAKFVLERRKSSQALSFAPCSTPKRKAMFIDLPTKVEGSSFVVSLEGG